MKKHLLLAVLFCSCTAYASADDCVKNSDACSAGSKKLSPFVEASLRQSLPPPAPAAAPKQKAVPHPGLVGELPSRAAGQAAPPAEPASAPAPAQPASGQKLSSPLWLIFAGGGIALLYLYLSGGGRRKKGRKQ